MKAINIEGVEDCIRMFEKVPENMMKISQKAMREASKATAKQIRQGIPKRWRKIVKYKVKNYDGKLSARVGLYGTNKNFDWFKAYWANYGTLQGRDPNHQFERKIKRNVRRRNNKGQSAQNFFEASITDWETIFVNKFESEVMRHEQELYNR